MRYCDQIGSGTRAKPDGAARLELFVDLVPEDGPMPKYPGEFWGGRAWYLRSFTKNPIEVEHPMPARPMWVVYWARWADATGEVGPFSKTVVAGLAGGYAPALPSPQQKNDLQLPEGGGEGELRQRYLEYTHGMPMLAQATYEVKAALALPLNEP